MTFATAVAPKKLRNRQLATTARRLSAPMTTGPGMFGFPSTISSVIPSVIPSSFGTSGGLFGNNANTTGTIIANVAVPSNCSIHQPYDIHLNLTDHAANMDKFMKMQIVYTPASIISAYY